MAEQDEQFFDEDDEGATENAEVETTEEEDEALKKLSPAERAHAELKKRIRAEAAATRTTVVIPLCMPIKVAGAEVHQLELRRLRAGDILANNNRHKGKRQDKGAPPRDYVADAIWLAARLAEVSPNDLAALDSADMDLLSAALAGFQNGRPAAP